MYDENKQEYQGLSMEELLVKGAQVTSLIQCTGLWFAGSKFGVSWKATQMRVDVLPQSARGFTFVDEGEEGRPVQSKRPQAKAQAVEDEEEDDEEEDAVFTAPASSSSSSKKSVVEAVMPKAQQEEEESDEEGEDVEPVPVPKKVVTSVKKKVVPAKK
jgi:hypothetical protein